MSSKLLKCVTKNLQESADNDTFCTRFSFPTADFPVEIKHLGKINFPVSTQTAKEIIDQAQLAPFGWRDQTVVDTKVRNVWEIKKSKIKLPDSSVKLIPNILERIKKNLNIATDSILAPEFHNMVIYEKGQFFSSHQDTEKCKNMIATMVILLPSSFKGGALTIDRQGDVKKYSPPRSSHRLEVIAFYTDCVHEVRKVTSGYRIALTFNLLLKKAPPIQALKNPALTASIKAYFSEDEKQASNYTKSSHPTWLVYLLDHQYSQYGLNWGYLKSSDRTHASQLLSAAEELGLEVHLSLADVHELWQTEADHFDWRYYGYENHADDYEHRKDTPRDDVQCVDLLEEDCELRGWVNSNGKKLTWNGHCVPEEMVAWTKATDNFRPFDSEYEGFMGNYGDTMEKWYHRAAITLWRKSDTFLSLFAIDAERAQEKVLKILNTDLEQGVAILKTLLPQWRQKVNSDSVKISATIKLSLLINDKDIATPLLESYGMDAVCKKNSSGLRNLAQAYGQRWLTKLLDTWAKSDRYYSPIANLASLTNTFSDDSEVAAWLCAYQLKWLKNSDNAAQEHHSQVEIKRARSKRISLAVDFLKSLVAPGESKLITELTRHFLNYPRLYDAVDLADMILGLQNENLSPHTQELAEQAKKRLKAVTSKIRREGDWSILEVNSCSCKDCIVLDDFLKNEKQKQCVWPLAQGRRRHIHSVIGGMGIGVSHRTQREGSPYKLVLKKLDKHFKNETRVKAMQSEKLAKIEALCR